MRQPPRPTNLDPTLLRELADLIPRASSVAFVEPHDDLAQLLRTTKGCRIIGEAAAEAEVAVALTDRELRSASFARLARHAPLALVVSEGSLPAFADGEWRIVERRPLAALGSYLEELPSVAGDRRRCLWPFEWFPPKRWLKYRLHRLLASARRIETFVRLGASASRELTIDKHRSSYWQSHHEARWHLRSLG